MEPLVQLPVRAHLCGLDVRQLRVLMDRYRGWLVVIMGTTGFDVTKFLAKLCEEYGVPVSCTSDGG